MIPTLALGGLGRSGKVAATGGDPNFSSVVALLHLDGADAGTTFTDVKGHTFSAVGNAQLDTAQQKWGSASLLLDGTGDSISSADSADYEIGAGDFTLECWVRFAALPTSGNYMPFFAKWITASNRSYDFYLLNSAGTLRLEFAWSTGGSIANGVVNRNWTPSTDTWYFVQFTRSGTTGKFGVDGSQVGADVTVSGTFFNGSSALQIGGDGTASLNGWIDDARFTNGVARAIALPGAAFPDL